MTSNTALRLQQTRSREQFNVLEERGNQTLEALVRHDLPSLTRASTRKPSAVLFSKHATCACGGPHVCMHMCSCALSCSINFPTPPSCGRACMKPPTQIRGCLPVLKPLEQGEPGAGGAPSGRTPKKAS